MGKATPHPQHRVLADGIRRTGADGVNRLIYPIAVKSLCIR